ncbi:aldo/keto reductase [Thiohalobacter sp. COW1]|uniref:aldo/keto reductase n=1 Tax=Thiohalobacter sp. COW1 TaxID=2795687 RepID=UPI0019157349|nr:aldo/keto reductase [Thiohalobacter sp. COW1]
MQREWPVRSDRRRFLQGLAGLGAALALRPVHAGCEPRRTRPIPGSDAAIPVIGMGTWLTFGIDPGNESALAQRTAVLRTLLEAGGGMVDSSPMYGTSEQVIGRCLQRIGHHRGLFGATKVWTTTARQGYVQMEHSKALWGLPRLDLMQVHNLLDWKTHLPNLFAMKARGEIRYVGVTTSHGRRHQELIGIMQRAPLDFVQFTYNVLDREAEQTLLPLARDRGMAVIVNRPFRRGALFEHIGNAPLPGWASEIECDNWAQVLLKFIVSHPAVTCAIPATRRVDHLRENLGAGCGTLPDAALRRRIAEHVAGL